MEIRPGWAELFHADGQIIPAKVAFRYFANTPINSYPTLQKTYVVQIIKTESYLGK